MRLTKNPKTGEESIATHLGDGAYAHFDGFGVWLMANHHQFPTDAVYLDPSAIKALERFMEKAPDALILAKRIEGEDE